MPHSSGGGSHGGGCHGGSHGGSGGSSGPRISRSHFAGAIRYRYFYRGQERYFYTDRTYKKWSPARLLIGFFYVPFLIVIILGIARTEKLWFNRFSKSELMIEDKAGVLGSDHGLEEALEQFRKKTGITPAVVTIPQSAWQGSYNSLERYAYNRYLNEFSDEMHWLIVYSSSPELERKWSFEGMQGNDTDSVLTEYTAAGFNEQLYANLSNAQLSVGESIADAFECTTSRAKKPNVLTCNATELFMLVFVCFHAYFMLGLNELKYRNAEYYPEEYEDSAPRANSCTSEGIGISNENPQPMHFSQAQMEPARMRTASARIGFEAQVVECRYCGGAYKANLPHCPHCGVDTVYNR